MKSSTALKKFPHIISEFSAVFHKEYEGQHRTASPLGAWMLLAYSAVNHPAPSEKLLARLGCSTDEAKEILNELLTNQPEVIASTVASWVNPEAQEVGSVQRWHESVADVAPINFSIPEKDELNEWTKKHSLGLMNEFPLDIDPDEFAALLATMVATKIEWDKPFLVTPLADMKNVWDQDKFLLEDEDDRITFYEDETGLYAIHEAHNEDSSLSVFSVIASSAEVSEADVMAVARKVALDGNIENVSPRSLAGETSTITVEEYRTDTHKDKVLAILPAWRSENKFEIGTVESLAYRDSASRFNDFPMSMEAVQVCVAEYQKKGFEAAALSTMLIGTRSVARVSTQKKVTVKFDHPYAVVAVAHGNSVWNRLPVFDGWVAEATEVKE